MTKDGAFSLPGKKVLKKESQSIEHLVVDVTESPINRPKKGQKEYYSGKKKRRTIKTQVIIERGNKHILDVQEAKGSVHDFKLYKETIGSSVCKSIPMDGDLGYLGLQRLHPVCRLPIKASKNHPLTGREKAYNRRLARDRVVYRTYKREDKDF